MPASYYFCWVECGIFRSTGGVTTLFAIIAIVKHASLPVRMILQWQRTYHLIVATSWGMLLGRPPTGSSNTVVASAVCQILRCLCRVSVLTFV